MSQITFSSSGGVPKANLSGFRLNRLTSYSRGLSMKVKIRDDLKAGGSLPKNFVVKMTSKGIVVDVTV